MRIFEKPRKLRFFLFLLVVAGATKIGGSSKNDTYNFSAVRETLASITAKEAQLHVDVLASDDFKGRGTGTPGQWLAAKYIAKEFASYGLTPAGHDNKFYQNFSLGQRDLKSALLTIKDAHSETPFTLKSDFIPFNFTGENRLEAPIVFAGYGITAPEFGYDDYANIDVQDKIVLVLRHEPQEKDPESVFNGNRLTEHAHFERKARTAFENGAAAMLLVTDPNNGHKNQRPQGYWPSFFNGIRNKRNWRISLPGELSSFPALWIGRDVAAAILRPGGHNLTELQHVIDETRTPKSFEISQVTAKLAVKLTDHSRESQNVLGMIVGSDPKLRDEVVVIGAHYDHIGVVNHRIHNGADDNASGVAGLLEIGQAFSELPKKPRRSVLFVAFSAEELGLLGSRYYVANPVRPLNRTVTMINMDMISRNAANEVTVVGSNRSRELHELNIAANEEIGFNLKYNGEKYFNRSDQANFAKHNIPVIFYNTDVHSDYHQPTDDADKINPEKLARVARLAFLVAWKVADSDLRPTYRD